jgi:hypothetical protein
MAKESKLSAVPGTKTRRTTTEKKTNRVADDAAKKAQRTEQKYDEKRGIFTK